MTDTDVVTEISREFEMVSAEEHENRETIWGARCLRRPTAVSRVASRSKKSPAGVPQKVGVFAGSTYPAIVRFSNDGPPRPDKNPSARGMAGIKLLNVLAQKILPGEEDAGTQDFVMQNYPIFFTDTARVFLKFVASGLSGNKAENEKFGAAVSTHTRNSRSHGQRNFA